MTAPSFTCAGSDLRDALTWITRLVPAKPPVPVLGGVLIEATEETLTFSAFEAAR